MNRHLFSRRSRAGFTLSEFMVVIAIICLLLSLAVPSYTRAKSDAQYSTCLQNLKNIGTAYQGYLADNQGIRDIPINTAPWHALVPQYLVSVPVCPSTGIGRGKLVGNVIYGYGWGIVGMGSTDPYWIVTCLGGHADVLSNSASGPMYSAKCGVVDPRSGPAVF